MSKELIYEYDENMPADSAIRQLWYMVANMSNKLDRVIDAEQAFDRKYAALGEKVKAMGKEQEQLAQDQLVLEKEVNAKFMWIIGLLVTLGIANVGALITVLSLLIKQ